MEHGQLNFVPARSSCYDASMNVPRLRLWQCRLRTLLVFTSVSAVILAVVGPSIARWRSERTKAILASEEYREIVEEWERIWYADLPTEPGPLHGGIR
jgi:hypothetical protein